MNLIGNHQGRYGICVYYGKDDRISNIDEVTDINGEIVRLGDLYDAGPCPDMLSRRPMDRDYLANFDQSTQLYIRHAQTVASHIKHIERKDFSPRFTENGVSKTLGFFGDCQFRVFLILTKFDSFVVFCVHLILCLWTFSFLFFILIP